jgi:hypothetical protein
MWQSHQDYNQIIRKAWHDSRKGDNLIAVATTLRGVQKELQHWSYYTFGSVRRKVKELRQQLEDIRSLSLYHGPTEQERQLICELNTILGSEETMMRQRSRVQWLREGDRNRSFFHKKAKERGRQNRIGPMTNQDGSITSDQSELKEMAVSFFSDLFQAQEGLQPCLITRFVQRKVTDEMNSILDAPFSEGEITKALFSMKPNKSPGVDGFTSGFFQKHWDLLKHDVVSAVLGFLNGGRMPHDINKTLIVLIPKVKHPQFLSQYRPISLCNVLYKICSKVLANRLKLILQDIIGEEQSAFVPGRLISDNVLTAYECIHYLKRKKGKLGACAIKIDMAKAYDRVEWQYLESMMIALGLSEAWTQRIMECVRTVSFSIRVNGEFSNFFRPST